MLFTLTIDIGAVQYDEIPCYVNNNNNNKEQVKEFSKEMMAKVS
jgi:hypothetical protein